MNLVVDPMQAEWIMSLQTLHMTEQKGYNIINAERYNHDKWNWTVPRMWSVDQDPTVNECSNEFRSQNLRDESWTLTVRKHLSHERAALQRSLIYICIFVICAFCCQQ